MKSKAGRREAAIRAKLQKLAESGDQKAVPDSVLWSLLRGDRAEAVLRKHLAESDDPWAIHHTVQVTSFGGCGTSALYDHLSAADVDVPKTPGEFPFRHLRFPPTPEQAPPGFRVVYLFGDPRNAVLSLFRRGVLEHAYRNLHAQPNSLDPPAVPEETRQRLASLESFLEAGIDEFEMEDHLERWLTRERSGYRVLFLRFESLTEAWPTVREFVGLPSEYPALELTSRRSNWESLEQRLREQIDRLYGGLAQRIERLPPVQIL